MQTLSLEGFTSLVRSRRTNLVMDAERAVPAELVEQLCALAMWAPNHKRTWPWRFAMFTGAGRARLGDGFVDDIAESGTGDPEKMARTRRKYLRAPVVLVIGSAASDKATTHRENMLAVAAGIQNMLLAATAVGLATYWESPPRADSRRVLALCQFEPDTHLVGVIYLGWPIADVATPSRPAAVVTLVDG